MEERYTTTEVYTGRKDKNGNKIYHVTSTDSTGWKRPTSFVGVRSGKNEWSSNSINNQKQ